MIYNMVHNEQDAWDLAQDSFVKAWKSIGRFRGKSSFYTWIYRIVMNVTIDWLRKRQIKAGGAEFDDAIQLKKSIPHRRPCQRRTRSRTSAWNKTKSVPGLTTPFPNSPPNTAQSF